MAKVTPDYNRVAINGKIIKDLLKFLDSEVLLTKALFPGLLPKGAYYRTMQTKYLQSVGKIYEMYLKFKDAGIIKTDIQPLALGQLSKDSLVLNDFLVASRWQNAPPIDAVERKSPSKRSLTKLIDKWTTFDRKRIGMQTVALKEKIYMDPKTKKSKRYYESDFYTKPLSKYPPLVNYLKLSKREDILTIKVSVAEAEVILISLIGSYANDNDILEFSTQDQRDSFRLINFVSGFQTAIDQTVQGIKQQAYVMYKEYAHNKAVQEYNRRKAAEAETQEEGLQLLKKYRDESRDLQAQITSRKGNIEALKSQKSEIDKEMAEQLNFLRSLG